MSGCDAGCKVIERKSTIKKILHIGKTGPRLLKDGEMYEECTLLQLIPKTNVLEPWLPDPAADDCGESKIIGMVKCVIDATKWTQPCSAGIMLKGDVNKRGVCWPEGMTPEQVEVVCAASTCCICFVNIYDGCGACPDGTKNLPVEVEPREKLESEVA